MKVFLVNWYQKKIIQTCFKAESLSFVLNKTKTYMYKLKQIEEEMEIISLG